METEQAIVAKTCDMQKQPVPPSVNVNNITNEGSDSTNEPGIIKQIGGICPPSRVVYLSYRESYSSNSGQQHNSLGHAVTKTAAQCTDSSYFSDASYHETECSDIPYKCQY
ncbi:unnamed protein product [Protopolystoma xenopodis]|uniref:Uncharacterized protein n=1 Tax=Protopolystoma xenopodis TaxID=117903 RepID=A0A448XHM5_9PLAT|nr:unnamed protein product [Protopolystoma xenopodis]